MGATLEQRKISVKEYHKMASVGILTEDDRVELLNGQIICMSPIGSKHAACVDKLDELLKKLIAEKASIRVQNPILLSDFSEPEPDLVIVKRKDNYYADRHPIPEEVILIIEVADSTLEKDRKAKLPLYAAAKIPEYWIVNLGKREIEVHQSPVNDQYRVRRLYLPGEEIALPQFGLSCQVEDLLI